MSKLAYVMGVYQGSDGEATKEMYRALTACGRMGVIAVNLFRAQKNSARAKVYRGHGYRDLAYDRKAWAMDNLCAELKNSQLTWGWAEDPTQAYHRWVLYVELPSGQVSFHAEKRGTGPDYTKPWDGVRDASPQRICSFAAHILQKEFDAEVIAG